MTVSGVGGSVILILCEWNSKLHLNNPSTFAKFGKSTLILQALSEELFY